MRKAMLAGLVLAMSGCGGSGALKLQLTDAPLELANVKSVNITLSKVEAHLAGTEAKESDAPGATDAEMDQGKDQNPDIGWKTVLESDTQVDLMQLRNNATTTLGELNLPQGKITQIRLFLDTSKPQNNTITFNDGTTCNLDVSEVNQEGIKIEHPFKAIGVDHGAHTTITVDFDAQNSVDDERTSANTCDLRLKPVLKVKAADEDGKDQLSDSGN